MVNFKLDMESNLPFDYIRRFAKVLFSPSLGTGLVESLTKCAIAIGNDSFLTDVNLFHSTQSVSLACVMLAASRFGHSLPAFCLPRAADSSPEKESYNTTEKCKSPEQFDLLYKQFKQRKEAAFYKTLIAQDKFEDFMSPTLDQTPSNSQCERKTTVEKPSELEDSVLRDKFD